MLTFQGDIIEYQGDFINYAEPTPPPVGYRVFCLGTNGSVSAVPDYGISGTEVTLYNYPDAGYEFVSYQLQGAYLKDANHFDIQDTDVTVSGCFQPIVPPVPTDHDVLVLKFASAFDPRSNFGFFGPGTWTNLGNNTWKFEGTFDSLAYDYAGNSPNFEIISGVQNSDAQNLFLECKKLTKVNDYIINGSPDTINPYNAISVFQGCINLTEADITLHNIKDATALFQMRTSSSWEDADNPTALTRVTITQTGYTLTNSGWMFALCHELEYAPYVQCDTVMDYSWYMYYHCHKVAGGALDMYNQLKNYTYPSSYNYVDCFNECGRDTVAGAAELAQIPGSWGGTL